MKFLVRPMASAAITAITHELQEVFASEMIRILEERGVLSLSDTQTIVRRLTVMYALIRMFKTIIILYIIYMIL